MRRRFPRRSAALLTALLLAMGGLAFGALPAAALPAPGTTVNFGPVTVSGTQNGNFNQVWDLTACPMTVSFQYDGIGMSDIAGAHAWSAFGVRAVGYSNFNPTWMTGGAGVWLATDYHGAPGTFGPDPVGSPTLDMDDKLLLQRGGGMGEGAYDLPGVPPAPGNNHRFWWDRDGVDPWQNPATANTGGLYNVVLSLNATGATTGTAYMSINGLNQGFETDGNWNTMELTPAGMNFTGNLHQLQVFYGIWGYGATHSATFRNISVTGCTPPTVSIANSAASEGAGMATFNLSLNHASGVPVSVDWVTVDGSATAPADYVAASGTVTFPAGSTSQPVSVPLVDDGVDEPNERFFVQLSNPVSCSIAGKGKGTGTIRDNDATPRISILGATGYEDAGTLMFPVMLDRPSSRTVTVNYATQDWRAFAPGDYTATSGTVSFPPGSTLQYISVAVVDDGLWEGLENFRVKLSAPVFAILRPLGIGVGTIIDDDLAL